MNWVKSLIIAFSMYSKIPMPHLNLEEKDMRYVMGFFPLVGLVLGGFTIAIIIMAGIRERNEYNDVPESFQGMPIVLLTAGLMSIAFFGFSGIL